MRDWPQKEMLKMKRTMDATRLNWIVTVVALAMAAVAGGSPLF